MTERTDLEWGYEPADAFENGAAFTLTDGRLTVDNGRAALTLSQPLDPVTLDVRSRAESEVSAVFRTRQILVGRAIKFGEPHLVQHEKGGGRSIAVSVRDIVAVASVGRVDAIVTDGTGKVVRDTRAERIAHEHSLVESFAIKAPTSATLKRMLASFAAAVEDRDNELVHLYEIRDAAATHYGDEAKARSALRVSKLDWQELGRLANYEPLHEGRHRGQQLASLRHATPSELESARRVAMAIMSGFASTV